MTTPTCSSCGKSLKPLDDLGDVLSHCPHCGDVVIARLDTPAATATTPASPFKGLGAFLKPPRGPGELGWLGPYRVLKVLGAGGMGVVFLAEDPELQRPVALKALQPELAASLPDRERFLREARAAAAVRHDRIVTLYHVGEDRGVPFLAMEFLQGESLAERVQREGKLAPAEVVRLGREIAEGLAAAHERGLIHRDVKPDNIFLAGVRGRGSGIREEKGEGPGPAKPQAATNPSSLSPDPPPPTPARLTPAHVKILDFGLAHAPTAPLARTQVELAVGTPGFMAPEQARGQAVDGRCDLFSLGCILYYLCTGSPPFQGTDTLATILLAATEQPAPPHEVEPGVPGPLSDLILRLLAKHPDDRPASAEEVAAGLAALEVPGASPVPLARVEPDPLPLPPQPEERAARPGLLRGLKWGTGLAALALLALGGWNLVRLAWHLYPGRDAGPRPAETGAGWRPVLARGQPLSRLALVTQPPPLKGALSMTLETRGHRGSVLALAASPEGQRLASAGQDGAIRLWEAGRGRLLRILVGHGSEVVGLAWSPDGQRLASLDRDGVARLWEVSSGQALREQRLGAHGLAWSPGGTYLALLVGNSVQLRDRDSGELSSTLKGPSAELLALAWSPDGRRLAAGCRDRALWVWGVSSGNALPPWRGHDGEVCALAWSPDGKTLASGGTDRTVQMWDTTEGTLVGTWRHHGTPVRALAWSADGHTLVSGSGAGDGKVRFWKAGQEGHADTLPGDGATALAWLPDGRTLVTGADDGTVRFWETPPGELLRTLPGCGADLPTPSLSWSPDGQTLAQGRPDGTVGLWSAATGRYLRTLGQPLGRPASLPLAWSPDGQALAFPRGLGVQRCDVSSGAACAFLPADGVAGLAWSPGRKTLAVTGPYPEAVARLLDPDSGQPVRSLPVGAGRTLAWSPDGKTVAAAGPGAIDLWEPGDPARDRPVRGLEGHSGTARTLAWSPAGQTLAVGGEDGAVRLWDPRTGTPRATYPVHQGDVTALAWLTEERLASLGKDQVVVFLDLPEGKVERTLRGLPPAGRFSPGATVLAAPFGGNGVRLWDLETGQPLGTLLPLSGVRPGPYLSVAATGHYRGPEPSVAPDPELVYVVQTSDGQDTLTPEELSRRHGWKNDPDLVRFSK